LTNLRTFIIFEEKKPITQPSLHTNTLIDAFKCQPTFTVKDVIAFYKQFESEIKRSTIDWRIHQLKELEVIYKIARGSYSLKKQKYFTPYTEEITVLYQEIIHAFPYVDICLWHTKWLNGFMQHQIGRFFTIIEVDKEATEAVFYFLKEKQRSVFLNPSVDLLDKYAINDKETIIIKPLISQAPTLSINDVTTAPLEKILVDLLCDDIFGSFQGQELKNIYQNAFEKYSLNKPQMLRYAGRRHRTKEVKQQLQHL